MHPTYPHLTFMIHAAESAIQELTGRDQFQERQVTQTQVGRSVAALQDNSSRLRSVLNGQQNVVFAPDTAPTVTPEYSYHENDQMSAPGAHNRHSAERIQEMLNRLLHRS